MQQETIIRLSKGRDEPAPAPPADVRLGSMLLKKSPHRNCGIRN